MDIHTISVGMDQQIDKNKAARDAAAASMNTLQGQASDRLNQVLNQQTGLHANNLKEGTNQLNTAADKAQQEAYINRMMQERNLGQRLSAMGKTGGASESTMLGLVNEYGNVRGANERNRLDNLANLRKDYNTALAADTARYNEMMNSYDQFYANAKNQNDQYYNGLIQGIYDDGTAMWLRNAYGW